MPDPARPGGERLDRGTGHGWNALPWPPRALILDFDHTLCHLGQIVPWEEVRSHLLATYRAAGVGYDFLEAHEGAIHLFERVAALEPLAGPALVAAQRAASSVIKRYERQAAREAPLVSGVRALVEEIGRSGAQAAIVTSNASAAVRDVLRREALEPAFAVVVGRDDVRRLKPSPEGIELALSRLGAPAADAVFAGDTVTDIQAARAAGVWPIGLTTSWETLDSLARAGAAAVARDLDDMRGWLAGRTSRSPRGAREATR